jgi:rod shape-determining protein MreC
MRLRPYHPIGLLLIVVLLLGVLALGRVSPFRVVRDGANRALAPVEEAAAYLRTFGKLREKNERLRSLAVHLAIENFFLREYRFENARLRRLLGFLEEARFRPLPARVVARTGGRATDVWKIDKGARDGIEVGMAVMNYRGLVGRIDQLFPSSAAIRTLRNQDVRVSALNQRSRVVGILAWEHPGGFRLRDIPATADVERGDRIVSSGLGGVFPPGIPLGRVTEVKRSRGRVFLEADVEPEVDFSLLEEVYVVLGAAENEEEGVPGRP